MMEVSLLVLTNGLNLIAQTDLLEEEPAVLMKNPREISASGKTLTNWPKFTADEHVRIRTTELLTICNPTEELLVKYGKSAGLTDEDLNPEPEPVMLTEEELPLETYDDDEYEPRYIEER